MRKVIILLVLFLNLSALDWYSYDEAVKLQEKTSKIIMIDVVRSHCQYCRRMNKEVFKDIEMSKWIQKRFIPVKLNLDKIDFMPLGLKVKMTPTFFFIDKNHNVIKKIPGSWSIKDFKEITKNIRGE